MNPDSTLNTALELRDIRGPVSIPGEWLWLWVFLGCAVLVGGYFLLRHLLKREKIVPITPPRPAWEVVLEAMAALERGGLIQQGKVKEYYSELSGIVRWYIEERFDVRAPEMTTEEFMNAVRYSDRLTAAHQKFLIDFLNASDMVKFAKFIPTSEEMYQGLKLARTFVEETR
jgi:hypothetical protein